MTEQEIQPQPIQPQPIQAAQPIQAQPLRPGPEALADAAPALDSQLPAEVLSVPFTPDDFRKEIKREKRKRRIRVVIVALAVLVVAACVAAFALVGIPSSFQTIASDDMAPVISSGQTVAVDSAGAVSDGDVIAYLDSAGVVQARRVVAGSGEWINVASDNSVSVSSVSLEGNAAIDSDVGGAAIIASRQVPDKAYFVLADRETSALEALYQSDNFIAESQVIGRITFRVWPIGSLGPVS